MMRHDQEKVFELRKQGKSYREIQKIVPISRDTLSRWFKNEEWSKHMTIKNKKSQIKLGAEHLKKMNTSRKNILDKMYLEVEQGAKIEFQLYKNDPLFTAGLMVYAGEGDKKNKNQVRLSNSEYYLHLVFIRFIEKFLNYPRGKIKFWLLLYPDHNVEECLNIWSQKLKIGRKNFHKSQIIQGKSKSRKLQYGVGNSIISNTVLKKKILKWLDLYRLEF